MHDEFALKKHVPGYDNNIDFARYKDGIEKAIERSSRLERHADDDGEPHRNPTTGVFRLAQVIRSESTPESTRGRHKAR